MKKTLTLTESELIRVINRIVESHNDEIYDDEDYVEVFLRYFRPWVKSKHGDEVGEYPLSYLTKKYMREFAQDKGMNPEQVMFGYRNNLSNAANIGKNLVRLGQHKMPSLRSQEMFTEKYKKPLEYFVNTLALPEFMTITFKEPSPYKVNAQLDVNWESLIKYQGEETFNFDKIRRELEQRIKDFLGVELGNPTHGQLSFNFSKSYDGVDEWVKQSLNKKIKKEIKALPNSKLLHAVRFETFGSSTMGGELKLSFKYWNGRNDFIRDVKQLLQGMGYNTNILRVVH
jgi:hypothetical protein